MKLVAETVPFPVPARLHTHLEKYFCEYGLPAATAKELHVDRLWSIATDEGEVVGYVWLQTIGKDNPRLFRSSAIFDEHQRKGYLRFALAEVEKILKGEGVKEFYAHAEQFATDYWSACSRIRFKEWIQARRAHARGESEVDGRGICYADASATRVPEIPRMT